MAIAAQLAFKLEGKEKDSVFAVTFVKAAKPGIFDDFIEFAKKHSELDFLVTEIGCGIAGFSPQEIAPLFSRAITEDIQNIYLLESFFEVIEPFK